MAINKDPDDTRTHSFGGIQVDPSQSGPYASDWPVEPLEDIDFAVVLAAAVIAYAEYDFQVEPTGGSPPGPWSVINQKFQPGIILKRLDLDSITGSGLHYAQIEKDGGTPNDEIEFTVQRA